MTFRLIVLRQKCSAQVMPVDFALGYISRSSILSIGTTQYFLVKRY